MRLILSLALLFSFHSLHAYEHQIAACAMFQNESDYLKEWIEYHKLIGVEHFYLFNNLSSDSFMEALKPYLKSGEVELFHEPTVTHNQTEYLMIQCRCFEKGIAQASGKTKWLALIDADEFIVPLKANSLLNVLQKYEKYGGLYVNRLMFGTSHIKKIPCNVLMIEALTRCAKNPGALGKSIVRPERVSHCTDPHRIWYHPPYDHVNSDFKTFKWVAPIADDKILIHHYTTRDLHHLIHVKYPRRLRWMPENKRLDLKAYIQSQEHQNVKENRCMRRFVLPLRARMGLTSGETAAKPDGCGCNKR